MTQSSRQPNLTPAECRQIRDAVFAPDIRITHDSLGVVMAVKALTGPGREYVAHNLIMRYSSVDDHTFPELCIEYVDLSDIAK